MIWESEVHSKYGENTIILMEIGSFFELYEVNNNELKIGKAKEIADPSLSLLKNLKKQKPKI